MIAPRPIFGICSGKSTEHSPTTPLCITGVGSKTPQTGDPHKAGLKHGVFASFDWLTATANKHGRADTLGAMEGIFGPAKTRHALNAFYPQTVAFEDEGAVLGWNEESEGQGIILQVQGHWFLHHPAEVGIEVVRELGHGIGMGYTRDTTRIDLALDFIGIPAVSDTLIPEATQAGHWGEYRNFDTFGDHNKYNRKHGVSSKASIAFGSRESECYLRIYDKGLEQKMGNPGEWVRLEAEFKGTKAPQVREAVLTAADPFQSIAEHVVGTIDFPERPVWERIKDLIGGGVRVRPAHVQPTVERWDKGFRNSYGAALLARAVVEAGPTDADLGRLVRRILRGVEPNFEAPVVRVLLERHARKDQE